MSRRHTALRLVSLYAGAGGMDYGFEAAGFNVRAALEMDTDACETLRRNKVPGIIERAIEDVASAELLETAGCRRGEVALLIGGPPCQPFSKSGYWSRGDTLRLADPRARTLDEFAEGLELVDRLTHDINRTQGTRYRIARKLLNAAEYGVPQIRERFFLVAHREGGLFSFPNPTHRLKTEEATASLPIEDTGLTEPVTAWDAIGAMVPGPDEDLRVRGKWADLLPSIPEGENYLWHTSRKGGVPLFGWRTRYWSFLLKLAKRLPSWTIQAQPGPAIGPFHWSNRLLSMAEMAAIQTFPSGAKFVGSRLSVQRQIGNAVPSLLAEVVGRAIGEQFFGLRYVCPPALTVSVRRPIPDPHPVARVRRKFLVLRGDHRDYQPRRRNRNAQSSGSGSPSDLGQAEGRQEQDFELA